MVPLFCRIGLQELQRQDAPYLARGKPCVSFDIQDPENSVCHHSCFGRSPPRAEELLSAERDVLSALLIVPEPTATPQKGIGFFFDFVNRLG